MFLFVLSIAVVGVMTFAYLEGNLNWKIIKVWFSTLFGLSFQQPYSEAWDKTLNDLMDKGESVECYGDHMVKIGKYNVWVSNRWYCYCHPYHCGYPQVRPSIKTMVRFSEYVDQKVFK